MARDKALDDKLFNCAQQHELELVASHYGEEKAKVLRFLIANCEDNRIKRATHKEVYELILQNLRLPIPV
jgi:hypothetical protein